MRDEISKIVENSIDFHIHSSPDPTTERSIDAHEAALQAKNSGMKGIVLKSHHFPTAPLANLVPATVEGIEIVGSLALNRGVGGINPDAVEASAKMDAKVIWMPTVSSVLERTRKGFTDGVPVVGEKGEILPAVKEVLALVKEYDMVVCSGHISQDETAALLSASKKMEIKKMVVTHPLKVAGTSVDLNTLKDWADQGALIEHCFGATFSLTGSLDPAKIVRAIKIIGADRCILSTDFGKLHKPLPSEGMRMMVATLLECGLTEQDFIVLVKRNPEKLLNLR